MIPPHLPAGVILAMWMTVTAFQTNPSAVEFDGDIMKW
jgi:hypothetical protein